VDTVSTIFSRNIILLNHDSFFIIIGLRVYLFVRFKNVWY
jgi:hypothetical protein